MPMQAPEAVTFPIVPSPSISHMLEAGGHHVEGDWLMLYTIAHELKSPLPAPIPRVLLVDRDEYVGMTGWGVNYFPDIPLEEQSADLLVRVPVRNGEEDVITEASITEGVVHALVRRRAQRVSRTSKWAGGVMLVGGAATVAEGVTTGQRVIQVIGAGLFLGGAFASTVTNQRRSPYNPPRGFAVGAPPIQMLPRISSGQHRA